MTIKQDYQRSREERNMYMSKETRTPLTPHRIGIAGRKRYSVETNASDYLDYNLDDIWGAIGRLWFINILFGILAIIIFKTKEK